MSVAAELQKAIFGALTGDADIAALIGDRIHDTAPAKIAFPYVMFGRASQFDWSTGTETGAEHFFTLHVWSDAKGRTELLEIMARIEIALRGEPLAIDGNHLVNLTPDFAEARFQGDLALHHGVLRYRAVTEPA